MREIDLTFGQVSQLVHSHTPIHREVADVLKPLVKQEHYQTLLAQDFIENEKFVKIARHLCKNDHVDVVHSVLAMDGMNGNKLNNGPNLDVKRYVENLKFGLSGTVGFYDHEKDDPLKRAHVYAVRQVYKMLPVEAQRVNNVFHIIKRVLQEYTGEEWTVGGGATTIVHHLDEATLQKGVQIYKDNIDDKAYLNMMQILKKKTAQPGNAAGSDDDDDDEEEDVQVVQVVKKRKVADKR